MPEDLTTRNPDPPPVCVVVSRYNDPVTARLREGALSAYRARFADAPAPTVVEAPGAFELPALSSAAIDTGLFEGIVALGCVIRGETDHDRYIAHAIADALAALPTQTGVPVAFGVLTVNTPEQAQARAGGSKGNKGNEAMDALLDTILAVRHLEACAERGESTDFRLPRVAGDKTGAR